MAPPDSQRRQPYRRRDRTLPLVAGMVLVSVGLHAAAFNGLQAWSKANLRNAPPPKPVELTFFEVEKPPPPPPPEEKPPEPPPRPKPVKPPPIKVATVKELPPPPKEDLPPPPNDAPPPEAPSKPVPLVVGISMSSTSSAGGFAAPVGNTAYGKVEKQAVDPKEVKGYSAPKYAPVYQLDRMPELLGDPKIPYPAEARRAAIEGVVTLVLRIDAEGNVTAVKVMSGPGYGLEQAAAEAIRRAKFRPATKNGEAVSTEIPYKYRFLLD